MEIVFEPVPERGPVSNYDIVRRFDVYNMAEFLAQVSDVTTKNGAAISRARIQEWLQSPFVRREQDG